jgi:nucleotide-binding universal stress UspA family protein
MGSFTRIIVPTDFAEPADRALDVAISLASQFDGNITLFHASGLPHANGSYADGLNWPANEMMKEDKRWLDALVVKAKERYVLIDGAVTAGEPWLAILALAKAQHADLIVMGTHGRKGLSRVFLGSVAEKVVRLSPIPVLTVSGTADREAKENALSAG